MAIRSVPELSGRVAADFEKRAREAEARFLARNAKPTRLSERQRRGIRETKQLSAMFRNV